MCGDLIVRMEEICNRCRFCSTGEQMEFFGSLKHCVILVKGAKGRVFLERLIGYIIFNPDVKGWTCFINFFATFLYTLRYTILFQIVRLTNSTNLLSTKHNYHRFFFFGPTLTFLSHSHSLSHIFTLPLSVRVKVHS